MFAFHADYHLTLIVLCHTNSKYHCYSKTRFSTLFYFTLVTTMLSKNYSFNNIIHFYYIF